MDEQHATVTGTVEYRMGDGPVACIPHGPVTVTQTAADVTLSWSVDESNLSASIPLSDFQRYLAESAIRLEQARP